MSQLSLQQFKQQLRERIIDSAFPRVTRDGLRDFLNKFAEEIDAYIVNIGFNTPGQIDIHIADVTIHFTEGSISHLSIQDIGSNSHAQIDTHIADVTDAHFVSNDSLVFTNKLMDDFSNKIPDSVSCVVFENEEDARHWILLEHTGKNQGVGIDPWGPEQQHRFSENASKAIQSFDFADSNNIDRQKVKTTNILNVYLAYMVVTQ